MFVSKRAFKQQQDRLHNEFESINEALEDQEQYNLSYVDATARIDETVRNVRSVLGVQRSLHALAADIASEHREAIDALWMAVAKLEAVAYGDGKPVVKPRPVKKAVTPPIEFAPKQYTATSRPVAASSRTKKP